jgi:hypothetical protein
MATRTITGIKGKAAETVEAIASTGPAAAAMVAGGTGTFVIGLLTTLAEASEGIKDALNLTNPVGPLSGKTAFGVIVWLIVWFLLNSVLKNKNVDLGKAFTVTIILVIAGLLLTFPPFFELFAAE